MDDPVERFRALTGGDPTHVAHAPGRVNLIGEHIDYVGLPVLPMAVTRRVTVWVRGRADRRITLANLDPAYPLHECAIDPDLPSGPPGAWGNYAQAAVRAVAAGDADLLGFDGLVSSDLPAAAGLSSSSALVVAVALALLGRNTRSVDPLVLAARLAQGEHYVGTAGGGMDQAASLTGRVGAAVRVAFHPLRIESIPIPSGWHFLVADSGERAEKSGAVRDAYNTRVADVEAARRTVAPSVGCAADVSYPDLVAAASRADLLHAAAGLPSPLDRRFHHIIAETHRVTDAVGALRAGDRGHFGRLMTASHESLRDDYAVSTERLDRLVEVALQAGADGARLTGAGFGGCVVVLCSAARRAAVQTALDADAAEPGHTFEVWPGAGATVTPWVATAAPA